MEKQKNKTIYLKELIFRVLFTVVSIFILEILIFTFLQIISKYTGFIIEY